MLIEFNLPSGADDIYSTKRSIPYVCVPAALGSKITFVGVVATTELHGFVFVFPNRDFEPIATSSDDSVPFLVPP